MSIVSSSYALGPAAPDGHRFVTETHIDVGGKSYVIEYLAAPNMDYAAIMTQRVVQLETSLAEREIEELLGG